MKQRDLFNHELRRFEALCTVERLSAGFRRVKKNKGAPGVDGVTIEDFGSRLREELSQLKEELESWRYKPSPVRRVEIPKPGEKASVYSVYRRVVHATLKELLEPIFEPLFSAHSYGFRLGRNQRQAVEAARQIVAGGKRSFPPKNRHLSLDHLMPPFFSYSQGLLNPNEP
jgi:retron-type reverse transcriptase